MVECDRCGIPGPDDEAAASNGGVTLQEAFDGVYCLACIDWFQERQREGRPVEQEGLDEYA